MRRVLALVIALAACGDDEFRGLPDAPVPPDTSVDTPTAGLVKLTITSGTTPKEGVKVYFQNSDSSMVSATTTDASGVASAVMEPGGFVTAIDPFPLISLPAGVAPPPTLKTFAGVKPGDELVLHEREQGAPSVSVTVNAVAETSGNVVSYLLYGPCLPAFGVVLPDQGAGSGGVTNTVGFAGCGATTDLTLVGFDVNGQPIAAIHKTGLAISEGGTIDLTGETYVATETATFAYSQVPAGIGSVDVRSLLATTRGAQFESTGFAIVDTGAATTAPVPRPVIANALQITATRAFGPAFGIHNVIEWGPSTTTYALAMGNILTPTILLPEFSSQPAYDLAGKTIRWTVAADGGRTPDLIVGSTFFQRTVNATITQWRWDIAGPVVGTPDAIRYPVLPSPDDTFNPTVNDDSQNIDELIMAKVPGGYDAVRENVFAEDDPASNIQGTGLVVGATGQVVFEEVTLGKGKRLPQSSHRILSPFADRLHALKARRR